MSITVVRPGVGLLSWDPPAPAPDAVIAALRRCWEQGLRRVECLCPAPDLVGRRILHRIGFRREGLLRSYQLDASGPVDVYVYSLLDTDEVTGPAVFSTVMNRVLPRTRVIAHVLVRDPAGRFLGLEVSYKRDWELPGGIVEPHEAPRVGAEREVAEELGLALRITRPLVIDWLPPCLGWDDAVEIIFDGGVVDPDAAFTFADGEITSAAWLTADDLAGRFTPLAERRLRWLLTHPDAPPTYFEDGRPA